MMIERTPTFILHCHPGATREKKDTAKGSMGRRDTFIVKLVADNGAAESASAMKPGGCGLGVRVRPEK